MYPPNRKAPTKRNTYQPKKKAANTPKGRQAAAEQEHNSFVNILVISAMVGAGIAFVTTVKANESEAAPNPEDSMSPVPKGTTIVTRTAPGNTSVPAPVTAPGVSTTKQTTIYRPAAQTTANGNYVFVDSWNGEGIYAQTSPIYNSLTGNGRSRIVHLPDNCFVGLWTGKKQDNMLEIWIKTSNGLEYNFWISADEVKMFNRAGYDAFMAGDGKGKTTSELSSIVSYFKK